MKKYILAFIALTSFAATPAGAVEITVSWNPYTAVQCNADNPNGSADDCDIHLFCGIGLANIKWKRTVTGSVYSVTVNPPLKNGDSYSCQLSAENRATKEKSGRGEIKTFIYQQPGPSIPLW